MASIPQTQIALNKQIKKNQILTIAILLILAAGAFYSVYHHNKLEEANEALIKKNIELEEKKGIIKDQSKKLVSKDSLEAAKNKQDESIKLLGVLLNDSGNENYDEARILKELSSLAEKKGAAIAKKNEQRKNAINQLFSNNESQRKSAQRTLIRQFGNDKRLVKEMLEYTLKDENFNKNNSSLYQVAYILTQLSNASLVDEKALIEQYMQKMLATNKAGNNTKKDFAIIRKKFAV